MKKMNNFKKYKIGLGEKGYKRCRIFAYNHVLITII